MGSEQAVPPLDELRRAQPARCFGEALFLWYSETATPGIGARDHTESHKSCLLR